MIQIATLNEKESPMKKTSVPCSIAVLLALLVFAAFPSSSALATCGQCADVEIGWYYGPGTIIFVEMSTATAGATIFFTTTGLDPTHNGATPGSGTLHYTGEFSAPYGHTTYYRAIAYKSCYTDSNVTELDVTNPNL